MSAVPSSLPTLVGTSLAIQEIRRIASRVAAGDAKVLITGESGVGKDLVARFVHAKSPRASRQMVAVNCAGLAETLLESELFGHVRGSFTGAIRDKQGKLQIANRGTVFLDEVGEMSLRMQALLLRFLENGEIQPVGTDRIADRVDVRVIAATNRDLPEMVKAGQFREDLMYRLNVVHIAVPALRERREDLRALVDQYLARAGRPLHFADDAWHALEKYRWPGNVRELQNVIEKLLWTVTSEVVALRDLPLAIRVEPESRASAGKAQQRQVADDLYEGLVSGRYRFWDHVHAAFLRRDITRQDIRELVSRGLATTFGSYRATLTLFGVPQQDYKKFLNFLSGHGCAVDYRRFRSSNGAMPDSVMDDAFDPSIGLARS